MNPIPNLCRFLHFTPNCPVCNEPLCLYLSVLNGPLWKTVPILLSNKNEYRFEQFIGRDKDLSEEDYLSLIDLENDFEIKFGSSKIYQKAKTWNIYFSMICNESGVISKDSKDFYIDPYKMCYMRTSSIMSWKSQDSKEWKLEDINDGKPDLFIRDEVMVFKIAQDNREKFYTLNINYEDQITNFHYFTATVEQMNQEYYEPDVFEKELPLLSIRPNFDILQRDKLIDRFNSWVLLS